jgi:mersacidin/lichenicidin family type 2 lantibiotic
MSNRNIVRAWKNEEYRLGLSESKRKQLPANPVGAIAVPDGDLTVVAAGGANVIRPVISHAGHCTSSRLTPCCF